MSYSEPPPYSRLRTDIAGAHAHGKRRVEELRLANPALADEVDRTQVDLLEVQSVGNHELDAVVLAGGDHALTFVDGDGHGLLAQHVHAGAGGADRVLGVHRVRQRDVDRVDALETLVELIVGVGAVELVAPGNLAALGSCRR